MTYGDDTKDPGPGDSYVSPDEGLREPDTGSSAEAEKAPRGDLVKPNGGGSLEERREGVGRRDDDVPGFESDESLELGALEALELNLKSQWSGPLPPPAALYRYEQIIPGAADRILTMAETTATGQIKTADKLADAEIDQSKQGQSMAFAITLIALVASIIFFAFQEYVPGGLLLSFPVIMLVRAFLSRS